MLIVYAQWSSILQKLNPIWGNNVHHHAISSKNSFMYQKKNMKNFSLLSAMHTQLEINPLILFFCCWVVNFFKNFLYYFPTNSPHISLRIYIQFMCLYDEMWERKKRKKLCLRSPLSTVTDNVSFLVHASRYIYTLIAKNHRRYLYSFKFTNTINYNNTKIFSIEQSTTKWHSEKSFFVVVFHIVAAYNKTPKKVVCNSDLTDTLRRLKQLKTYYKLWHTKEKIVVIAF